MRRPHVRRLDGDADDSSGEPASFEVYEPEPVDTGLLDQDGTPIWRLMNPIGFVELKEH